MANLITHALSHAQKDFNTVQTSKWCVVFTNGDQLTGELRAVGDDTFLLMTTHPTYFTPNQVVYLYPVEDLLPR